MQNIMGTRSQTRPAFERRCAKSSAGSAGMEISSRYRRDFFSAMPVTKQMMDANTQMIPMARAAYADTGMSPISQPKSVSWIFREAMTKIMTTSPATNRLLAAVMRAAVLFTTECPMFKSVFKTLLLAKSGQLSACIRQAELPQPFYNNSRKKEKKEKEEKKKKVPEKPFRPKEVIMVKFFKEAWKDYMELMGKIAMYGNPVRPF